MDRDEFLDYLNYEYEYDDEPPNDFWDQYDEDYQYPHIPLQFPLSYSNIHDKLLYTEGDRYLIDITPEDNIDLGNIDLEGEDGAYIQHTLPYQNPDPVCFACDQSFQHTPHRIRLYKVPVKVCHTCFTNGKLLTPTVQDRYIEIEMTVLHMDLDRWLEYNYNNWEGE